MRQKAPLYWSEEDEQGSVCPKCGRQTSLYDHGWGKIEGQLAGNYQIHNTRTILLPSHIYRRRFQKVTRESVREAFGHVVEMTSLCGRWQEVGAAPLG